MTPMVLASAYLGGCYFFVRVLRERRWASVKSGFLAVALFAALLGVATILHWDRFNHGHVAFWLWVGLYLTAPFLVIAAVDAALTPRTVALDVNPPSNPPGRVLPRIWLEALVRLGRRHDLWLLFDEVYEDYVYRGEHVPGLSLAPERAFAVHSFSKAYGMAATRDSLFYKHVGGDGGT